MSTKLASDDVYSETSWWTITLGGGVRGVPKASSRMQKCTGKQIMRSTEPLNQQFSIPVLAYLHSANFACFFLLIHQLVRSELRAWTVFWLTWSVIWSLHSVHCSLLPEQGKSIEVYFTSEHSFTDLRCVASSNTQTKLTREARSVT